MLQRTTELINRLKEQSSIIDKKEILKQYPDLQEVLRLVYDPQINFWVTGDRVEESFIFGLGHNMTLLELLRNLSDRTFTGNEAVSMCVGLIQKNIDYKDTIIKILNKDLECGIAIEIINDVFSDLIFNFKSHVPLAKNYKDFNGNVFDGTWFLSRKLDGERCLAFIENNDVKFMSRNGKEIKTLDVIKRELLSLNLPSNTVLDGEICIVENGQEYFSEISKYIRRKDYTIQNPMFYIFDWFTSLSFYSKKGIDKTDYNYLKDWFKGLRNIKVLDQIPLQDESQLEIPQGWEGFILRKKAPTEFKRSNNLLKVKSFFENEYKVVSIQSGTMVIDGNKYDTVGSLLIEHKGEMVGVGSGLSQEQRLNWLRRPEQIIGKIITVKYFSESIDKNGNISLRFPTLKNVREDI